MNYKNYLLATLVLMAGVVNSFGQIVKFTGLGGYTVQDKVYGYYGDVIIRDGASFAGVLSFEKSRNLSIDLTYNRQVTTFSVKDYYNISNTQDINGTVGYIMIGASHSPDFTAKVAPYAGFMLGTAIFSPKEKYAETWKFALGGKLGVIVHASDKVGIVLQTQLMVPVQSVGYMVGCGTSGCGSGASTSSSATQLGFMGGLEIKLNN